MFYSALTSISLPFLTARASRARLSRMFTEHYRAVWRVARRMGASEPAADDVAQQAFLVAAERVLDIENGRERAFLFGTAIRLVKTQHRHTQREPSTEEGDERQSPLPGADELTDQKKAREVLDVVLKGLSHEQREVFVLHEFERLTMREIAEVLQLAPGTVASRLRRARTLVRDSLSAALTKAEAASSEEEAT